MNALSAPLHRRRDLVTAALVVAFQVFVALGVSAFIYYLMPQEWSEVELTLSSKSPTRIDFRATGSLASFFSLFLCMLWWTERFTIQIQRIPGSLDSQAPRKDAEYVRQSKP